MQVKLINGQLASIW